MRRVDIGALDGRDVAELEAVAAGANREHLQIVDRIELAADAHLEEVGRRVDDACRLDCILLAELRDHGVEVEPQLGEALLRNLDEDFFVLCAEDLDLVDVFHLQEALAHAVGLLLQLLVAEAIA